MFRRYKYRLMLVFLMLTALLVSGALLADLKRDDWEWMAAAEAFDPENFNPDFGFRVLLTGGAWYRGVPPGMESPCTTIVQALDGTMIEGARVYGQLNFCLWDPIAEETINAAKAIDADIIITLGQAGSAPCPRLEKYGCNTSYGKDNYGIMKGGEDADGNRVYEPIDPNGPAWYESTLDCEGIAAALLAQGIPCEVGTKSHKEGYGDTWFSSAGSYLCNFMAYSVPHLLKREGMDDVKFLFIHHPTIPEYRAISMAKGRDAAPCMDIDLMIKAIRMVIAEAVAAETGHRQWYTPDRPLH